MTHPDSSTHAWVDESVHSGAAPVEPFYVLAAAIGDIGNCGRIRDALRALLLPGAQRLHWRDESSVRRHEIAAVIAELELMSIVVVGAPVDLRRQERARRRCMERLFYELSEMETRRIWLESRTPTLNRKDRALVDAVRSKRILRREVAVDFSRPGDEPMLWVPDAVAGAVGAQRKGHDSRPRARLGSAVEEIRLDLA